MQQIKKFLAIFIACLALLLPATALATTAVPWSITNLTDGFIFPNLINGSAKGILVSASSTVNGAFTVSTSTSGCATFSGRGLLYSTGIACGTGGGSTPGGLNTQVQYNNAGSFGGISGAVTDGTILSLTNALLGGATLTTSVVNGVTLTAAGSATTFLNGTGAYTTADTFGYPFPGNATTSALTLGGLTLSNLAGGGTLCVHVNNAGVLSTAAGDCGTSGGSITAVTATYPVQSSGGTTPNISTAFGTTTNWGIGTNGFLVTGPTGIPFVAASSTLNLPNTALQNSSITINGTSIALGSSGTISTASSTLLGDTNTFSGTDIFSNTIKVAALSGFVGGNSGTLYNFATSTIKTSQLTNDAGFITSGGIATTSLAATAPITLTISSGFATFGTSFSTSTFNAFSAENTFTNLFATNASSTNSTTTNLALVGATANCNGTSALTTNSSGVVGCTAQPQGTLTALSVASANGFAGSSSGGATPALTLTTTITGLLKGNGTAISAASNGTDFSLITANTCGGGQFFSGATAAGVFTCGTPAGGGTLTAVTGTWPILSSGGTTPNISWGGIATSSPIAAASGLLYATGVNTFASISTSSPLNFSITGNASTVTTNANLTGVITSSGNTTSFGSQAAGILGNPATGNTFVQATSTLYGAVQNGQMLAGVNGLLQYVATTTFSGGLTYSGGNVTNSGVLSNIAGSGIGVSGTTGAVTISNTGVTSIVAGTNVTISGATGAVTINSSGGGGSSFGYPFPVLGIGTTSPIMLLASTTIGNGTLAGGLTVSGNATTTALVISSLAGASGCLTPTANGTVTTTGCSSGGGAAFPFTPTLNFGVNTSATSTPLFLQNGLFASSTSAGGILLSTPTNITNAFSIFNAAGANVLNFDDTATHPAVNIGATATNIAMLSVQGDGTDLLFAVATTSGNGAANFEIDSVGHIITSGNKPTVGTCTAFAAGTGSNDTAGTITLTSGTSCIMNFAHAWAAAPVCIVAPTATLSTTKVVTSTTQLTVTFGTGNASFSYICEGKQ